MVKLTEEWKVTYQWQEFLPIDAEEILKIRIHKRPVDDVVAWHFEKTVSSLRRDRPSYKYNWQAEVPPKVKILHGGWLVMNTVATNTFSGSVMEDAMEDNLSCSG
uniref:Uncharacterized protein n=1 Tax=Oryza nivara TaxID=4536 RepID=A0A0E0IY06_ORYNI